MADSHVPAPTVMTALKVRKNRVQTVALGLLTLILVPLGVGVIVDSVRRGGGVAPILIGAAVLTIFAVVARLVGRADDRSVQHFTKEGLVCNDGTRFAWSDLDRVVYQVRMNRVHNRIGLWRTEIHFTDGQAWLLPTKVSNLKEVMAYVNALPCEHVEVPV